jgi:SAM-dependent methyltransferase
MEQGGYIFGHASEADELGRLELLESVFDEKTRHWLRTAGAHTARRCLEVGAGAGSVAQWLAAEVGPSGQVAAIDPDTRFLRGLAPNVEVVEGHLGSTPVPLEAFDLAHARYVLIHNANARGVLEALLGALKPGAAVLLEEPDFSAGVPFLGPAHLQRAFENVKEATRLTFRDRKLDYAFGRHLPALVKEFGLLLEAVEYDASVARGASPLAEMMRRSTVSLQDKYVKTGAATYDDIVDYCEFSMSADCWGIYYATVRVLARKRAA